MKKSPKKAKNRPFRDLTHEEVLLRTAEASIKRFGVILPTTEMIERPPAHVARMSHTMTKEQMLLAVTEASLRQFGTVNPPREILDAVMDAECPHCGKTGLIADHFGFKRRANGAIRPQSWCAECRAGPDGRARRA